MLSGEGSVERDEPFVGFLRAADAAASYPPGFPVSNPEGRLLQRCRVLDGHVIFTRWSHLLFFQIPAFSPLGCFQDRLAWPKPEFQGTIRVRVEGVFINANAVREVSEADAFGSGFP